jgi:hypothetical protein
MSTLIRGVRQCEPQPTDGRIDTVFKINQGIIGPESFLNLAAHYYFPGTFQQHCQNLERLLGQHDLLGPVRSSPDRRLSSKDSKRMWYGAGAARPANSKRV